MAKFISAHPPFSAEASPQITAGAPAALGVPAASGASGASGGSTPAAAGGAAVILPVSVRPAALSSALTFEVGDALVAPIILRGGKEIAAPALNDKKVEDFLSHTLPVPHGQQPVAISQSIPPGTRVAKGTPVDLVLLATSEITFGLFDTAHADLAGKSVTDVAPILNDPQIGPLLDKGSTAALSDQEKTTLRTALAGKGITVSDTDPTRSLDLAFASLAGARAFQ